MKEVDLAFSLKDMVCVYVCVLISSMYMIVHFCSPPTTMMKATLWTPSLMPTSKLATCTCLVINPMLCYCSYGPGAEEDVSGGISSENKPRIILMGLRRCV